jgi:hypothetical protein
MWYMDLDFGQGTNAGKKAGVSKTQEKEHHITIWLVDSWGQE